MNPLVVVIPSRSASNLAVSIPAVRKHEPDARIIVVDDGVDWCEFRERVTVGMEDWWSRESNEKCAVIPGVKPFVFARNVNIGMRAAGEDSDCVILNDDAILQTPGGFSILQAASAEDERIGIIGAVTDLTGQPLQCRKRNVVIEEAARHAPSYGLRAVEHIAFVCVLIPARTRRKLDEFAPQYPSLLTGGFLDERFTAYGSDDLDACWQCARVSLCVCVHDGCYVDHGSLRSSYRGAPTTAGDIWPNHRILRAKWGMPPNPADPEQRRRV